MRSHESWTAKEIFDRLLEVTQNSRFLSREGLANEIPYFICPYDPSLQNDISANLPSLVLKLKTSNIRVLTVNLFDLALQLLEDRGILHEIVAAEPTHPAAEFRELLQSVLDAQDHLAPAIVARLAESPDILFITGIGEVFPFVRAHALLNNLQSAAGHQLTILFFPGTYTQALESGATLDVLGLRQDDRYYRAFNILEFEV